MHPHPPDCIPSVGLHKPTVVHIDSVKKVVTQAGAIQAALSLCPRECFRLHIARCPVCTRLEDAAREIR